MHIPSGLVPFVAIDLETPFEKSCEGQSENQWRSQLFSWHPNVIAFGRSGSWPLWSWRTLMFYGLSVILWIGYFFSFTWLRIRTNRT